MSKEDDRTLRPRRVVVVVDRDANPGWLDGCDGGVVKFLSVSALACCRIGIGDGSLAVRGRERGPGGSAMFASDAGMA